MRIGIVALITPSYADDQDVDHINHRLTSLALALVKQHLYRSSLYLARPSIDAGSILVYKCRLLVDESTHFSISRPLPDVTPAELSIGVYCNCVEEHGLLER